MADHGSTDAPSDRPTEIWCGVHGILLVEIDGTKRPEADTGQQTQTKGSDCKFNCKCNFSACSGISVVCQVPTAFQPVPCAP